VLEAFGGGIGAANDAPERTDQEEDHELAGDGPVVMLESVHRESMRGRKGGGLGRELQTVDAD
jgi:hypothetical protein